MCTNCNAAPMLAMARRTKPARKARNKPQVTITHEQYIASIVAVLLAQPTVTAADRTAIERAKLTYGWGERGVRGVTIFGAWHGADSRPADFVAVNATWQRTAIELCETMAHELGHVTAGHAAGHTDAWKAACARLGFTHARATDDGSPMAWDWFAPDVAAALQALPLPTEGSPLAPGARRVAPDGTTGPVVGTNGPVRSPDKPRPCGAGWGTRGGKSRGAGAGSRYLKWSCGCKSVRHAGRDLNAVCQDCGKAFALDEASLPPAHTNGGAPGVPGGKRTKGRKSAEGAKARKRRSAGGFPKGGQKRKTSKDCAGPRSTRKPRPTRSQIDAAHANQAPLPARPREIVNASGVVQNNPSPRDSD